MVQSTDPPPQFNFVVEIDGLAVAGFLEMSGLESQIDVIEYREGGDKFPHRKLPGKVSYANIVLRTGITENTSLYKWHADWLTGVAQVRKQVKIILLDRTGTPQRTWRVVSAWPAKWVGPTLNAMGNDVAIETIELAHEGIELE